MAGADPVAAVRGFERDEEVLEALLMLVERAVARARDERADTPAVPIAGLMHRLRATRADGPVLAVALHRWALDERALLVLAASLAAALSPRLGDSLAALGSAPGALTAGAAAALLGANAGAVLAVTAMLAPGGCLHDLALILPGPPGPPLHRAVVPHPRLLAIASGQRAPHAMPVRCAAPPAPGPTHFDDEDAARLRALAARPPAAPVFAWLVGHADADLVADLQRVLAVDDRAVLVCELSSLLEESAATALWRELALARAALAIRVDTRGPLTRRDAARLASVIDWLAARPATVCAVCEDVPRPALPTTAGALVVRARASKAVHRRAALATAAGDRLPMAELDRVAALLPGGPGGLSRIAGPLHLQEPDSRPARRVVELAAARAPASDALVPLPVVDTDPGLTAVLQPIVETWLGRARDRLAVFLQTSSASEARAVAAQLSDTLLLPCLGLRPGEEDDRTLPEAIRAATGAGNAVLLDGHAHGARPARISALLAALTDAPGLLLVAAASGTPLAAHCDLVVTVPSLDHGARVRLWEPVLRARGLDGSEALAFASEFPFSAALIARVDEAAGASRAELWMTAAAMAAQR